jgi:hypothetical protein
MCFFICIHLLCSVSISFDILCIRRVNDPHTHTHLHLYLHNRLKKAQSAGYNKIRAWDVFKSPQLVRCANDLQPKHLTCEQRCTLVKQNNPAMHAHIAMEPLWIIYFIILYVMILNVAAEEKVTSPSWWLLKFGRSTTHSIQNANRTSTQRQLAL